MEALKLMVLYWGVMLIGYLVASRMRHLAGRFGFIGKFMTGAIVALVFIMGLKMGANEEIIRSLGTIGIQSVLITVAAVGGSMLFVTLGRTILHLNRRAMVTEGKDGRSVAADGDGVCHGDGIRMAGDCTEKGCMDGAGRKVQETPDAACEIAQDNQDAACEIAQEKMDAACETAQETPGAAGEETGGTGIGMTLLILLFVAVGMAAGYLLLPRLFSDLADFQALADQLLVIGICVLLLLIGFDMGLTGEVVENLKHAGLRVALIPVLAVVGSLAGGMVYGLLSPLTVREAAAVSAGFGWYTLAPTLITEAGHAVAGAVSFLHNVIREVLGIVCIPLAAKKIGYLECTAIPGVAAMDICLPIVERACNQQTIVYSFLTGFLMSASVPVLVPLLIG